MQDIFYIPPGKTLYTVPEISAAIVVPPNLLLRLSPFIIENHLERETGKNIFLVKGRRKGGEIGDRGSSPE